MASVSKEDYLKKYLSGSHNDGVKKKKRKQKPATHQSRMKIVDDDVDFKSLMPSNIKNTLDEDIDTDKPTVAEFIDERPKELQILEKYRKNKKWKLLNEDIEDSAGEDKVKRQRHDSDSDRDSVDRRETSSSLKKRHDSDSDASPPRNTKLDSDSDQSFTRDSKLKNAGKRKQIHEQSDYSPKRKQNKLDIKLSKHTDIVAKENKTQRKRTNSDSHLSPERGKKSKDSDKSKKNQHSDYSPKRSRNRKDTDQSPIRSRKRHDSDQSPQRSRKRHDSDSDQSPQRSRKREDSNSDQSPQRSRKRQDSDSDQSPQRSRIRQDSDYDQSPQRRRRQNQDSDESPPRSRKGKVSSEKMKKTLGGAKAGLSSAKEVKDEVTKLKRKEDDMFDKIGEEQLGKNAKTVFRDKSGKRRDIAEEQRKDSEEAKKKAKKDEQYEKWGKGLSQLSQQQSNIEDAIHEMSKPMTRYKDDADLDEMLKQQEREGDPMAAFLSKKKKKAKSNVPELPKYSGRQPPPNRFNIWPGYRWDGVDRSNGFEAKLFASKVNKKAIDEIAYKWSTEDM